MRAYALFLVFVLFIFLAPGCGSDDARIVERPYPERSAIDRSYGAHDQQVLDVYGFEETSLRRPVVVWVHGGGWRRGDKSNNLENKRNLFADLGYVLVSVNYRLADPQLPVNERPMHPAQVRDVAASIGWVRENIAAYGGNPARIALMGHSAGGHLVSLVGVHPGYLAEAVGDEGLGMLSGVVAVDTAAYDLVDVESESTEQLAVNAFGTDPAVRVDASPIRRIANGRNTPPFLILTRGTARRVAEAEDFHKATVNADPDDGGDRFAEVQAYDHEEINDAIGEPGETEVTPLVKEFLRRVFDDGR